jgi:hypothetical protein
VGRPGLRRHRHFDVGKKAERQRCGGSPPGPVRGRRCFKGRRLHRLLGEGRSCGDTGAATRTPSASKITDPLVFRQWLIVPEGLVAQKRIGDFCAVKNAAIGVFGRKDRPATTRTGEPPRAPLHGGRSCPELSRSWRSGGAKMPAFLCVRRNSLVFSLDNKFKLKLK